MNTYRVSIIMPVYNAQDYLVRVIESVKSQTYTNWELIIVDDGSQDRSREICIEYENNDSRILLVCNEHSGTSRARNAGIQLAKGEYITFIDADDVYHPQFLESMLKGILQTKADMAVCGIIRGTDASDFVDQEIKAKYGVTSTDDAFRRMYQGEWGMMIAPYNKLYDKKLFENIKFPEGHFFEDAATMNLSIYYSNYLCVIEDALYFYNITPNSSSMTKKCVELLDREDSLRSHWEFFLKENRMDLAYLAIPFYLSELITIYHKILFSDKPEFSNQIRFRFEECWGKYKRNITLTQQQSEWIFAFRYPRIYDIRNMLKNEGICKTIYGFAKRKLEYIFK